MGDQKRTVANVIKEPIHSEELNHIITRIPSWIERWGIVVFITVILLFIAASAFIHYPETLSTPTNLVYLNKPTIIKSPVSGVINILAKHRQKVEKGTVLATVTNSGHSIKILSTDKGHLNFLTVISPSMTVNIDEALFSIRNTNDVIYGRARLNASNFNIIKCGQHVLFNADPNTLQKSLVGYIYDKPDEPESDGFFTVLIRFNDQQSQNIIGGVVRDGKIILKEETILKRILNSVMPNLKGSKF